jgi:para-nitrobenzyl esterase
MLSRTGLALAFAAVVSTMAFAATDQVKVEGGLVSGTTEAGVRVFKGIPFAAPPVGELRWRPPQPLEPWRGVRDGSKFGSECPQTQYGAGAVYIRPLRPQSEDCLFLNVWTRAKAGARRPVFVWIHGGALTRGSGISDVRDGAPLARKGPVVVSINYRLGPLGYLAHPELTAESGKRSSGNYGVLDQIAALVWVQQNIAAFGGDPAHVTIGGESAGAWSVNTLLASPLARGLFIRAIGGSGGRFSPGYPLPAAEAAGQTFMAAAGASSIKALRGVAAGTLVALPGFRTQEVVDGWVLPDEIRTIFAHKTHNNVPVIVGQNLNEMTSLTGTAGLPRTLDEYRQRVDSQYGELSQAFDAAYGVKSEADIAGALLGAGRDTTFSLHMRTWARMTTAAGSNAYLYLFSHVPPSPRKQELLAFHASELPYVFDVLASGDPREAGFAYTDVDRGLAARMSGYWVNFIMTGDPNGKGLPQWLPYDPDTEPFLEFGETTSAGNHLFKAQPDFLEKVQGR